VSSSAFASVRSAHPRLDPSRLAPQDLEEFISVPFHLYGPDSPHPT
jgi:hypothetical protein